MANDKSKNKYLNKYTKLKNKIKEYLKKDYLKEIPGLGAIFRNPAVDGAFTYSNADDEMPPLNPTTAIYGSKRPVNDILAASMQELAYADKSNLVYGKPRTNKLWSAARLLVPGVNGIANILNFRDAVAHSKHLTEPYFRPDTDSLYNYNRTVPKDKKLTYGEARDNIRNAYKKLADKIIPLESRSNLLLNGIPAAAGISGGLFGMYRAHRKSKKEDEQYSKYINLISSPEFRELPEELQRKILNKKVKKRGSIGRALRAMKYGIGYGIGSQLLATPLAKFTYEDSRKALQDYINSTENTKLLSQLDNSLLKDYYTSRGGYYEDGTPYDDEDDTSYRYRTNDIAPDLNHNYENPYWYDGRKLNK